MKSIFSTILFALSTQYSGLVHAFPEAAHGIMAGFAFDNSVLSDDEYLRSLGFADENRTARLESSKGVPYQVSATDFSKVKRLVEFGAVREDALAPPRMLNHFFDVQNSGQAYSDIVWTRATPSSSLVWSLEPDGDINNWLFGYDQELSYKDALQYYSEAMSDPDLNVRDQKMGLVFQIMGHLTHHIQDMAQPEHTRGDNHFDSGSEFVNDLLTPDYVTAVSPSLFEQTVHDNLWMIKSAQAAPYVKVDIRKFDTPDKFWTNGSISSSSNLGVAAFSSRNYISQDTNYNFVQNQIFTTQTLEGTAHPTQALPAGGALPIELIPNSFLSVNFPGTNYIFSAGYYAGNSVVDNYESIRSFYNNRASAVSLVALADATVQANFHINKTTVRNQVDTLVPRAISYSTAMINYFFRGKLEFVEIDPMSPTSGVITLKNQSGDRYVDDGDGSAFALDSGTFRLFVESATGDRQEVTVTSSSSQINYGDEFELNYDLSVLEAGSDLSADRALKFVVLYEGLIGNYDAVASLAIDRLGTLLLSDKLKILKTGKQLAKEGPYTAFDWHSRNSGFSEFNIDWKGRYRAKASTGQSIATRTVSFSGPRARFFGSEGYDVDILVDGRYIYRSPFLVLGAAMRQNTNGDEYIMAVVHDPASNSEMLLRKKYLSVSNVSKNIVPLSAASSGMSLSGVPDWEMVADLSFGANYPGVNGERVVSPWFFNGEGNKASTLREKRVSRYFDSNLCSDQSGYVCDDPNSGYAAGDYVVSVLNRYELTATDAGGSISNKGFEIGDKAELGLDYKGNELVILNTRNIDYETVAPDSAWLFLNDEPFLDRSIYDCRLTIFNTVKNEWYACRPIADTALAPTGFPGLHTRWVGTPVSSSELYTTSLHLSYIDLRTNTFEFSKVITEEIPADGDTGKVEYWVSHDGQKTLLFEQANGVVDCVEDDYLYMSPYGKPAFLANYFDLEPTPPVRGQYALQSSCTSVAPINKNMVRGVDRHSTYFTAGQNGTDNSYYNFLSTGDDPAQYGILNTETGTPEKVIVR